MRCVRTAHACNSVKCLASKAGQRHLSDGHFNTTWPLTQPSTAQPSSIEVRPIAPSPSNPCQTSRAAATPTKPWSAPSASKPSSRTIPCKATNICACTDAQLTRDLLACEVTTTASHPSKAQSIQILQASVQSDVSSAACVAWRHSTARINAVPTIAGVIGALCIEQAARRVRSVHACTRLTTGGVTSRDISHSVPPFHPHLG
jgi:hypothetical protein